MASIDLQAVRAAGLYDDTAPGAADRLALLEFLAGEGCTLQEMVQAHAAGRLFALAGDRAIYPGVSEFTIEQAAGMIGLSEESTRAACRAFGMPQPPPGARVLTRADVTALRAFAALLQFMSEAHALGLARVMGSAVARIAEAEFSAFAAVDELVLDHTGSELETARAYADVARLVPQFAVVLDVLHRRQVTGVRRHFEQLTDDVGGHSCGVGFTDVAGFTALSRSMPLDELADMLSLLEAGASNLVYERGGRVVKFIGDAVMFVAPTPAGVADIAYRLVHHQLPLDVQMRAAATFGGVLAHDGDYFGTPVNLAARLLAVAEPGEVVTDATLGRSLESAGWRVSRRPSVQLRGFDEEVVPVVLEQPPPEPAGRG